MRLLRDLSILQKQSLKNKREEERKKRARGAVSFGVGLLRLTRLGEAQTIPTDLAWSSFFVFVRRGWRGRKREAHREAAPLEERAF
jgi:hypothetical protein